MIGVRSSYIIRGEKDLMKTFFQIYIKNPEDADFSDTPDYTINREIYEGDFVDLAPLILDSLSHKIREIEYKNIKIQYGELDDIAEVGRMLFVYFDVVDGFLYYNQEENEDLYKDRFFLLSSKDLKIGGDYFYLFAYQEEFRGSIEIKSYPNGKLDRTMNVLNGFHKIEFEDYLEEEYIVLINDKEEEVIIKIENEEKYNTHFVDFVNRFGVWERLFFTKKETSILNIESSEYQSAGRTNFVKYAVNGRNKINLNTFWIPQSMNETINQLMLSEEIYLDNSKYNIDQKSINFKSKVNDGLISYEITFINSNNIIK